MNNFSEIISLIILGVIILAIVKFQIYLSKKESFLYGLILPALSFLLVIGWYVLLTPASMETADDFSYTTFVSESTGTDDTMQEETPPQTPAETTKADADMMTGSFITIFTFGNIGTVFLLIIYWIQRRKRTLRSELERMKRSELC